MAMNSVGTYLLGPVCERDQARAEIAEDAIGWIEKNRIGKSQWVKSSGVANAT